MVTRIFARPHTKSPVAVAVWRRIHLKFASFDKKLHHWEQVQQLELCDSRSILAPLTLSERGIMLCAVLLCISSSAICASWIPCISSLAFLLGAKDCLELSWNEICCCKSASPVSGSPWTGLLRCSTNPSGWLMSPKFYNYDQLRASIKAWFCRRKSIDCFPLHSTATVLQDGWTKGIERGAIRGAIQFLHSATCLHWSSLFFTECLHLHHDIHENAPLSIAPLRAPFCPSCIELNASYAADQDKANVSQSWTSWFWQSSANTD